MVKRTLITLAAVAAGTGAVAAPAHARAQLGIMDPTYQLEQPDRWSQDIRALRPKVLRYDLLWSVVGARQPARPTDPSDPAYDWSYMDSLLRGARDVRVPAIVTVWKTPRWAVAPKYRRIPGEIVMPQLAAWRSFIRAAATRYSGRYPDPTGGFLPRVQRWEIWNETNLGRYFQPQGRTLSPMLYTQLLNGAYDTIKSVAARQGRYRTWIAGGSLYRSGVSNSVPPLVFLQGMRRYRAKFDVISAHPYNSVPSLGITEGAGRRTVGGNIATGNFHRLISEADRLWKPRRVRFWVTEYAWQTWPDRILGVSPSKQAQFMLQGVRLFRSRYTRVEFLVWFLIQDEPTRYANGVSGWQSGLRFFRSGAPGAAKPSFRTFQLLAR